MLDFFYGWSKSPLQSFGEAEKNAEKAIVMNESLDIAHVLLGWVYLFKRQHDEAIKEGERSIELNPNGAEAHAQLAFILIFSDKTDLAIKLLKRAFRLNPIPPPYFYDILSMAHRNNGNYREAIKLAEKSLIDNPNQLSAYLTLASLYSLSNRAEDARKTVEEILILNPNFSLENYAKTIPYKRQETADAFVEALRRAGLPE
jgi:tetratricopeptide (TPR) repeat protein